MSRFLRTAAVSLFLLVSYNAQASNDFFGGDDCPPWAYDCNDWPVWTPMYWMEEMSNEWDNNNDYYPYGGYGYGQPPMPYYGGPQYGNQMPAPMPYGQQQYRAPMPYYGGPQAPAPAPAPAK